jgi:hypothetical protein
MLPRGNGARDVSQRAEPDIRPLGRAASAFIADEARRLSNPLAGDVPPSAFNEPCPFCWQMMCHLSI